MPQIAPMIDPPDEAPQKISRNHVMPPLRVTSDERDTIKTRARDAGLSTSEFQRRAVLNGQVVVRESAVDVETMRLLLAVGRDLRGATNNLNQLTKSAHIHGAVDMADLERVLSKIEAAVDRLLP